jgi:hexosaminidase
LKKSFILLSITIPFILGVSIISNSPVPVSAKESVAGSAEPPASTGAVTLENIIPKPVLIKSTPVDGRFTLTSTAKIYVNPGNPELIGIGQYLAGKLNPATGYGIRVFTTTDIPATGNIYLTTDGGNAGLGEEGYQLTVAKDMIVMRAYKPAGLFRGIQTIRQMLPSAIESATVQPGPWEMASGVIRDYPRFAWRGAMLDVARHFFSVADVKRYIDELAYYKMNRFHIHLSDDQGWRIAVNSWPNLAKCGGSTQVGGGPGGYYTQAQYSEIVAYAAARYITVVPEIDMPGHTHAALASYAVLNANGVAPTLYTGIKTGFSSLAINKDLTYTFVDNVIKEIAGLTPGDYIHIGGDEVSTVKKSDYVEFVSRVQASVQSYGKQMIGWEEIATEARELNAPKENLSGAFIAQHWNSASLARTAVQKGVKIIMSPASKTYLDMKYDSSTPLGQKWAGYTDVMKAYNWEPATEITGVSESNLLGIEAPLWTETIATIQDIEYMAFPRLIGIAEIGWSQAAGRNWTEYSARLGTHGSKMTARGINFYRSPQVPWR